MFTFDFGQMVLLTLFCSITLADTCGLFLLVGDVLVYKL